MKKILYIAVIIACFNLHVSICHAQRIHGFVSGGITAAQIEGDELKGFNQFGFNGGVGALTAISSNGLWGLSVEINYNERGSYSHSVADKEYMVDLKLKYVDIPGKLTISGGYSPFIIGSSRRSCMALWRTAAS